MVLFSLLAYHAATALSFSRRCPASRTPRATRQIDHMEMLENWTTDSLANPAAFESRAVEHDQSQQSEERSLYRHDTLR